MRETIEFRVVEDLAREFLPPDVGERMGLGVRAVTVSIDDPLYTRIGEIYRKLRKERNAYFFLGTVTRRRYSRFELVAAELFQILPGAFQPAGEECGTIYDDSSACPHCGVGRRRIGDLVLDVRKVPRTSDIASTIADELIVSQRLAELLVDTKATGFSLTPVRHVAHYEDDPMNLKSLASGKELLRRAARGHVDQDSWEFMVWVNRPPQRAIYEEAMREHRRKKERRERAGWDKPLARWYSLDITGQPARLDDRTRCGSNPFGDDEEDEKYRCPKGHVCGLGLLSEVFIRRDSWDGSDVVQTFETVGTRRGLLVPSPIRMVSQKLWASITAAGIKGTGFAIAYLRD